MICIDTLLIVNIFYVDISRFIFPHIFITNFIKPNKSFFQAQPLTKMQNFCPPVPLTVSELHPSSNNRLNLREWGGRRTHNKSSRMLALIATQKDLKFRHIFNIFTPHTKYYLLST